MLKIVCGAALMAVSCLPAVVSAQDRMPDIAISYRDLDLATADGLATLDRRLDHAVNATCPSDAGISELSRLKLIETCRAEKRREVTALRSAVLAQMQAKGATVASVAH